MSKPRRPRAETPKGFRDHAGAEVTRRREMLGRIAEVYEMHGFQPLETSAVETVDALGKFLPDLDRPNEGVFAWEEDGAWLALRYDMTAPLARYAAQAKPPLPYRRYAMGPVWRNEKPGPGRFRQFYQCDADTVGAPGIAADAEIVAMLCAAIEAAGIPRDGFVIKLNDRKVLNGVMEAAGIAEADEAVRGIVLRAIDKLDRLGPKGVRALLGEGREDESGDYTKGAGLGDDQIATVLAFTEARRDDSAATLRALRELVGSSETGTEGIDELEAISALLDSLNVSNAVVDPSIVRGLGYYTGPVHEAELISNERSLGSVAAGGRYDDLVMRFTGQRVPSTGTSVGVDRLLAALDRPEEAPGPVVVTVMDRERMSDYMAMAAELRAAGIPAEVYLGNPKNFGNQLKYADRRASPAAIVQGSDEHAEGMVQIKDLALGTEIARTASLEEWKGQPAQRAVPRSDLVSEIKAILAR